MTLQLPPDIDSSVKAFLVDRRFADETEVLREALAALKRETAEVAAIQLGVDDMEAGRYRPLEEIDAEIRREFGFKER
jgi:predicted transcriptional regulator